MCAELLDILSSLLSVWTDYERNINVSSHEVQYSAPLEHTGARGRPKFVIPKEQLVYLKSLNFTWSSIALLLGVTRMTIYRRRVDCGMLNNPLNRLSDDDLEALLKDLKAELP